MPPNMIATVLLLLIFATKKILLDVDELNARGRGRVGPGRVVGAGWGGEGGRHVFKRKCSQKVECSLSLPCILLSSSSAFALSLKLAINIRYNT